MPSLPPTTMLGDLVAVEVGDDAGRVDAALCRGPLPEQVSLRVEDEGRVERRDDLELPVAVQVDEARRCEPACLAGRDVAHELRLRDGRRAAGGDAAWLGGVHGGAAEREQRSGEREGGAHGAKGRRAAGRRPPPNEPRPGDSPRDMSVRASAPRPGRNSGTWFRTRFRSSAASAQCGSGTGFATSSLRRGRAPKRPSGTWFGTRFPRARLRA